METKHEVVATVKAAEFAVVETAPVSLENMVNQVVAIQKAMENVMKDGTHFGKIPGCGEKPSLLKPGAEKICLLFRLVPHFEIKRTDFPGGHREYEIVTTLQTPNGNVVGQGVGSCSTMESKYRWRNSELKCPKCEAEAIKKSKFPPKGAPKGTEPGFYCFAKIGGCGAEFAHDDKSITEQSRGRVENSDIADTYNTVLKMAKKRSHVDATLTATAAGDIFTQDIEDFPQAKTPEARAKDEPIGGHGAKPLKDEDISQEVPEPEDNPWLYKLEIAPQYHSKAKHGSTSLVGYELCRLPRTVLQKYPTEAKRAAFTPRDIVNIVAALNDPAGQDPAINEMLRPKADHVSFEEDDIPEDYNAREEANAA